MAEVPEYILARRAAREAQRRRQRWLGIGAALAALVAAGALLGIILPGTSARHAPPRVATAQPVRRVKPRVPVVAAPSLDARGIARIRRLAGLGLPLFCAGPRGHELAFTFDDGPGPYTHLALRKLRAAHERATFFVVGRSMTNFPGWIQRETAVGEVGDHTMTHPFLPGLTAPAIDAELSDTQKIIQDTLHRPVVLFRPPYGSHNATVDATARRLGLLEVLWSVDSRDSLGADWRGIIRNVEAGMRPGAIILMHENRGQTIRALATLLPELRRRHLRSVSLPELLATDPPSTAQLRAGEPACGALRVTTTGS